MSMTGSFVTDKAIIASSIFLVTFIGSCIPWMMTGKCRSTSHPIDGAAEEVPERQSLNVLSPRLQFALDALTCFSGGVIAAAGFVDVFPDALATWQASAGKASIPSVISLLTLLFLWFIDRGFGHAHENHENPPSLPSDNIELQAALNEAPSSSAPSNQQKPTRGVYILCAAMTFHSFCDGLAIGSEAQENQKFDELVIAILLHKGLDGVALGVPLFQAFGGLPLCSRASFAPFCLLSLASLTAPIGLVIGMQWSSVPSLQSVFLSIACGSLLFISLVEMLPTALNRPGNSPRLSFLFIFLGASLVILLSFFV
jgi:zinc transporter ZupT